MLIRIFQYRSRNLGWAFAGGKRAANVRGRNRKSDSVQAVQIDPGRHIIDMAGAADHQETDAADHVLPPVPGADFGEGIGANEKEQLVGRVKARAQLLNGVDGIAPRNAFLETGDREARLALASEFGHANAIRVGRERDARFVGRMGGGDEEDAVQVKAVGGLACDGQVRVMDGVERAAEDCEFQRALVRQPGADSYCFSILTELMRTSFLGRSCAPRATLEIFSTTS